MTNKKDTKINDTEDTDEKNTKNTNLIRMTQKIYGADLGPRPISLGLKSPLLQVLVFEVAQFIARNILYTINLIASFKLEAFLEEIIFL